MEGFYEAVGDVIGRGEGRVGQTGRNISSIIRKVIDAFRGPELPKQPPAPTSVSAGVIGVIDQAIQKLEAHHNQYGHTYSAKELSGHNEILTGLAQARLKLMQGPGRQVIADQVTEEGLKQGNFLADLLREDPAVTDNMARESWGRSDVLLQQIVEYGPQLFEMEMNLGLKIMAIEAEITEALTNWQPQKAAMLEKKKLELMSTYQDEYKALIGGAEGGP
jgi:hypothetical protein